jgi:hypothetical protein
MIACHQFTKSYQKVKTKEKIKNQKNLGKPIKNDHRHRVEITNGNKS